MNELFIQGHWRKDQDLSFYTKHTEKCNQLVNSKFDDNKNLFRKESKQKSHRKLLKRLRSLIAQDYFVKTDKFQFLMKFKILNRKK